MAVRVGAMMVQTLIIAALCGQSTAQYSNIRKEFDKLQATKHHLEPIRLHHGSDCWTAAHLNLKPEVASLLQQQNVPGAGIDKFKPFKEVLKDGFLPVDCVKDYMYYRGDKFGDNRHDYKVGPVSNVSIVHYDDFVAKEDQADMTQKKCFEFCRTVPNMGYFGIVNGRGCYCTPYFTRMASDSSSCDSVCEGDNTIMCGGKSKSSIFAMHMCDSTEEDLGKRTKKASNVEREAGYAVTRAKMLSNRMQDTSASLQKRLGAVGDTGATGLLQDAKVFAGDLVHKAEEVEDVAAKLGELSSSASSLSDFKDPTTVTKAERIMEGVDEGVAKAIDVFGELAELSAWAVGSHEAHKIIIDEVPPPRAKFTASASGDIDIEKLADDHLCAGPFFHWGGLDLQACAAKILATPEECQGGHFDHSEAYGGCYCQKTGDCHDRFHSPIYKVYKIVPKETPNANQYYPVMYFVDKAFEKVPTTCSGDLAAKPITTLNKDGCAAACDANVHNCVGYQYFKEGKNRLCFLFENFKTGVYYTGCGKSLSFLQEAEAPFEAACFAKLSKFVGTTLKPNPSGKCKQCFKTLTKADRCYK